MKRKHEDSRYTQTAQHIATACLKIAAANHYLVGLVGDDLSFDDLSDAKQILITLENADTKHQHRYDLAFMVLDAYAQRVHRCAI